MSVKYNERTCDIPDDPRLCLHLASCVGEGLPNMPYASSEMTLNYNATTMHQLWEDFQLPWRFSDNVSDENELFY